MLAKVGFESSALLSPRGELEARADHRALIDLLLRHGVIVVADKEDRAEFLHAIHRLPQAIRKLWEAALEVIPIQRCRTTAGMSLLRVTTNAALRASWSGWIDVAYLTDGKITVLGVDPEETPVVETASDIELARPMLPRESERLRAVELLGHSAIPSQTPREDVWSARIKPVVDIAPTVTIVDRYAGSDLIHSARPTQGDGVRWFLESLRSEGSIAVHLITEASNASQGGTISSACARLRSTCGDGVSTFSLTMACPPSFRAHAHTRHLRAGHVAVILDRGLALFEREVVTQSTPCYVSDRVSALDREANIEKEAIVRRRVLWASE